MNTHAPSVPRERATGRRARLHGAHKMPRQVFEIIKRAVLFLE